jgi:hypothetical protein
LVVVLFCFSQVILLPNVSGQTIKQNKEEEEEEEEVKFKIQDKDGKINDLICIATGTGIAPFRSFWQKLFPCQVNHSSAVVSLKKKDGFSRETSGVDGFRSLSLSLSLSLTNIFSFSLVFLVVISYFFLLSMKI